MEPVEEIQNYLIQKGFSHYEDVFEKVEEKIVGQMIVNGKQHYQTQQTSQKLKYLGNGWLETEDHPIYGYRLVMNEEEGDDYWVSNLSDFQYFFHF